MARFWGSSPRRSVSASSAPIVAADVARVEQHLAAVLLDGRDGRQRLELSRRQLRQPVEPDGPLMEALRDQLVDRAHLEDLPVVHDRESIAQDLGLLHVVRREQDRPAIRLEAQDEVPQRSTGGGVETRRRLVEEDELGVVDQRQGDAPAAAAGPPDRTLVWAFAPLAEVERVDRARPSAATARRSSGTGRGPRSP